MLAAFADQHVHAGTIAGLRRRGMDVVTTQERALCGVDDEHLLACATAEGRLMLTYDTDFLRIHGQWLRSGKRHAGIAFWPGNQRPIGNVIRDVLDYASHTSPAEATNVVKYV